MERSMKILGAFVGVALVGLTIWMLARPTVLEMGPPPMQWGECQPEQVEVLILGTFHFAQQDEVDVLAPDRQEELVELIGALAKFAPDKVAVESPYDQNEDLNNAYRQYLAIPPGRVTSRNETVQIGFRLARSLGHDRVFGVDVPMNMWHDSIQVFDDMYPGARGKLRRKWSVRYPPSPEPEATASLMEMLRLWNGADPPGNSEYGLFMPLVEGDVYAGALKLRAWYDRNLRVVQNLFRVLSESDDRLVLIIGGSHVRVLRQILDMTPQLCAGDPLSYMTGMRQAGDSSGG